MWILRDDHRPELTAHESDDGDFDLIRVTERGLGEHFFTTFSYSLTISVSPYVHLYYIILIAMTTCIMIRLARLTPCYYDDDNDNGILVCSWACARY